MDVPRFPEREQERENGNVLVIAEVPPAMLGDVARFLRTAGVVQFEVITKQMG